MSKSMENGLKIGAMALLGVVGSLATVRLVRRRRKASAVRHRIKYLVAAGLAQVAARRLMRRALMPG